eukprot:scaffold27836_cov36-Prasinocladus_malaysianus.AAC.1
MQIASSTTVNGLYNECVPEERMVVQVDVITKQILTGVHERKSSEKIMANHAMALCGLVAGPFVHFVCKLCGCTEARASWPRQSSHEPIQMSSCLVFISDHAQLLKWRKRDCNSKG